ncbi:unnamed protein product [Brassica rapa subsp. trilocularis]
MHCSAAAFFLLCMHCEIERYPSELSSKHETVMYLCL